MITGIGRLFTAASRDAEPIADAVVAVEDAVIAFAGARRDFQPAADDEMIDVEGALVTPGLVDAHTHPVYAGDRFAEIAARTDGASYAEIAQAGGGIGSTVRATRAAARDDLADAVRARLARWPHHGATTVEAKTGYHLERDGELGDVALLYALAGERGLPRIETTFLAAHAVPPDGTTTAADYAAAVASWCTAAATAGARHCDVFCDEGYFTVDQSRTVLDAGAAAGLVPRIHADELARTGGAQLAATIGAASADHLLRIDGDDVAALAAAHVVAVLCPVTAMSMGARPPARALLDAGVTVALGSDHNPGTSGLTDMTIVIALAVAGLGLSVADALYAATSGGARSLRRDDIGVLRPGAAADVVVWDADHEGAFAWAWGVRPRHVWIGGIAVDLP